MYIRETELTENGNFHLLLQRKFHFLGRQTINGNQRLRCQPTCHSRNYILCSNPLDCAIPNPQYEIYAIVEIVHPYYSGPKLHYTICSLNKNEKRCTYGKTERNSAVYLDDLFINTINTILMTIKGNGAVTGADRKIKRHLHTRCLLLLLS
jgi:hypothetical protein